MVDSARVHRLLGEINRRIVRLRRHAHTAPAELLADETELESVKYLFVTAIEGAVDVAQHLCADQGWGAPDTNADAFVLLGRFGVIDQGLVEAMVSANGFRNVLVHGYADVDDRRVVAAVGDLGRLDDFVAAVSRWLLSTI